MIDHKILSKMIEDCGANLYDTESVIENERKIFRLFIAKEGGVSLDLCAQITRIISPILDLDPPMSGTYTLEVSSAGIERKLITLSHFKQSIGENVKVKIQRDDANTTIKGKLMKVTQDAIMVYDKEKQTDHVFSFSEVMKARTYFQW